MFSSKSEASESSQIVLKVERVELVFFADVHRAWTFRDLLTRVASDPAAVLLSEKDRLHVLRDVTFEVKRGERVGIIGVNGVGKSSLCRSIAGMYRPTRGRITVNGIARGIFDTSVGIHPELTGRENADLLAEFMFPGRPDKKRLVDEALEFSGLKRFVDVPFKLYSNGMQARLCLSLISSAPADLLILDEVFDGADVFFREKIAERVLKMIEASGAVLFVSHSPDQLTRACNRLIVLHDGKIAYDGPVAGGLKAYESLGGQA